MTAVTRTEGDRIEIVNDRILQRLQVLPRPVDI